MRTLVFDTETTALVANSKQPLAKQPQIVEVFALVLGDDLEEQESLQQYFDIGKPLPDITKKITGITDEMVKGAPSFAAGHAKFQSTIESCDRVVAHNLSYDIGVTDFEFERLGKAVRWPASRICTVEATEHMKGYRLNLGALYTELFGEQFTGAHRAENDVRALARCYLELVKRGEV